MTIWRSISPLTALTLILFIGMATGVEQKNENAPKDEAPTESTLTSGSDLEPTTTDAYCSMPQKIDSSVSWSRDPSDFRFKVGHRIDLTCVNSTFTLTAPSAMTCIDPGVWNFEGTVACHYVVCSPLVAPGNGSLQISAEEIVPQSTAHFHCNQGYVLVGEHQLTCMNSGQWTDAPPVCAAACTPRPIQNGTLQTSCGYENCMATASCIDGLVLTGNSSIICTSSGEWHATEWPACTVVCPPPAQIADGTFVTDPLPRGHHYVYQTLAQYSCTDGYSLYGDPVLSCTEHGTWNGSTPRCKEIDNDTKDVSTHSPDGSTSQPCPPLDMIPNGLYSVLNSTVNYTCDHGYRLQGSHIRTCQNNGKWSGEPPSCILHKMDPESWWKIFQSYREWQGKYIYNDQEVGFKFWFLSAGQKEMHALLRDDLQAKLDLKGTSKNGVILFQTHRLLKPSNIMTDLTWQVRGELGNGTKGWKYTGTVHASEKGYSSLFMEPVAPDLYEKPPLPSDAEYASATALALGIAIAIMAIIVAAILAAYCVKQKGFKGSGHRTLTSFENPVYEYENNAGMSIK